MAVAVAVATGRAGVSAWLVGPLLLWCVCTATGYYAFGTTSGYVLTSAPGLLERARRARRHKLFERPDWRAAAQYPGRRLSAGLQSLQACRGRKANTIAAMHWPTRAAGRRSPPMTVHWRRCPIMPMRHNPRPRAAAARSSVSSRKDRRGGHDADQVNRVVKDSRLGRARCQQGSNQETGNPADPAAVRGPGLGRHRDSSAQREGGDTAGVFHRRHQGRTCSRAGAAAWGRIVPGGQGPRMDSGAGQRDARRARSGCRFSVGLPSARTTRGRTVSRISSRATPLSGMVGTAGHRGSGPGLMHRRR